MARPTIADGFRLAGMINIGGVLLFSAGFTDPTLGQQYPAVFAPFGLASIMLWGLAYLAVARRHAAVPWLVAVFAVEKAVYVATWVCWMLQHGNGLGELLQTHPLAGTFFLIYGPNDLAFGVFFLIVFLRTRHAAPVAHVEHAAA